MKRLRSSASAALALGLIAGVAGCSADDAPDSGDVTRTDDRRPPLARIQNVVESFHGVEVDDPYRWLEDWNSEEVKTWTRAQEAYASAYLDALPEFPAVQARVRELYVDAGSVEYDSLSINGETLFALKSDPRQQQSLLVSMPVSGDPAGERVIVDPNTIDATGLTTIDWYKVSNAGDIVAVSLSRGGSEAGDIHLFAIETGDPVGEVVSRVQGGTAGGDVAWQPDDSGFYYTRYPRVGERAEEDQLFYVQVYLHRIGESPEADTYVLGEDFPRIAEIRLFVEPASGRLLITVQDGDSSRFAHFLRQPDGEIVPFSDFGDGLLQFTFGNGNRLYGVSWANDALGEIIALDAGAPNAEPEIIVPAGDGAISHSFYDLYSPSLLATEDRLYALYQVGGPYDLRAFDLEGNRVAGPETEPISTSYGLTDAGDAGVLFATTSYVTRNDWFNFDPNTGSTRKLPISAEASGELSDISVVREFATSVDGTEIPVNVLVPPGAVRDGTGAIVVTGYGGYGSSNSPGLNSLAPLVMENGVYLAIANLRGGGEYGEAWHRAGMLTEKQNVFDDFIAVIEHLVAQGYADRDRVGIYGGSNGGLLMGAVVVQRPDLARAVVSRAGIYDSLRFELDPNGAFNVPEFGSVKDPDQFAALYAYSPYHNVRDGIAYPAILLTTGANDPRVNPMNSRKFAARLEAAQAGDSPILLRTDEDGGHGVGASTDQRVAVGADQYAFLFHHLGVSPD